jgi:transcription antitermination factor NusA-like protein
VPTLASGELRLEAVARRPGVLTKVAVRSPTIPVGNPSMSIAGDDLARVREMLQGERIDVVAWHHSAPIYITAALGLAETPPMLLLPALGHARVLLGEIDLRGIAGWRGLNVLLASALTGWRIRLESVSATDAWHHLQVAMHARRPVRGTVLDRVERAARLDVIGLYAVLSSDAEYRTGQELAVRITRMDPDEGRIFASDRLSESGQLPLL